MGVTFRQSWALSATIRQIENLSIDIVGYRLSMNRGKYICRPVVVDLKLLTDKVGLSMKILEEHCRSIVVGLNFETDKVVLSMENCCVIVGLSLSGSCL